LLSFICLGSWANTFKRAGSRWRFELFSFDFAIGALLLAVLAAYTFGTFGSELGFSDRMLVSGRTNQALAVVSGGIFALGNMLLLSAISLIGMSAAFPLAMAAALAIGAMFQFRATNVFFLLPGIVSLLVTVILSGVAAAGAKMNAPAAPAAPPTSPSRSHVRQSSQRGIATSTKGIVVGLIGGIVLGGFFPIADRSMSGEFGLGGYAGTLMICIGLLPSTIVLNVYFMNIAIHGGPLSFDAYFKGKPHQHFFGFASGAVWALGTLASVLALSAPETATPGISMGFVLPAAAVLLAMFWGVLKWKEFAAATKGAKTSLFLSAVLFLGGVALIGIGATR
jgi:glucose uptake protein